jgi:hypothetical protein
MRKGWRTLGLDLPALACRGRRPLYTRSSGGLFGLEVVDGVAVGADGGPGDEQGEEGGTASEWETRGFRKCGEIR